jgi:hypothetical protein
MKAEPLANERHVLNADTFVDIVIWRLPRPMRGSAHRFKYRLALIHGGVCVLRYDNEAGKGDHRHVGPRETPYSFTTPTRMLADFWSDVDQWRLE